MEEHIRREDPEHEIRRGNPTRVFSIDESTASDVSALPRRAPRENAEGSSPVDAVDLEVAVVGRQDRGQRLAACEMNERRVGEVHRRVGVALHEPLDLRKIAVRGG